MVALGMPRPVAAQLATSQGPEMGRAILALYRSNVQPALAEAGKHLGLAAQRPGLAIVGTEHRG
jgi:hypothetical protein